MTRYLFYLVGVPGVGKTTVFRRALDGIPAEAHPTPFAWTSYPNGAQLGAERGTFSGTDMLPMNIQPRALMWLDRCPYEHVVAEGDRLANGTFFEAVKAQGWRLTVGVLDAPPAVAATRREIRRSYQSPSWLQGRLTKVANLTRGYVDPEWRLDATQTIGVLAESLKRHPAFAGLRG